MKCYTNKYTVVIFQASNQSSKHRSKVLGLMFIQNCADVLLLFFFFVDVPLKIQTVLLNMVMVVYVGDLWQLSRTKYIIISNNLLNESILILKHQLIRRHCTKHESREPTERTYSHYRSGNLKVLLVRQS